MNLVINTLVHLIVEKIVRIHLFPLFREMDQSVFVGIDLGGTSIKYAAVSNGTPLWTDTVPTNARDSRDQLIERLAQCTSTIQSKGYEVTATGIGTPGLVDVTTGFVKGGAYNLPDWENLPLGEMISKKNKLPVFVDNDANLMGLGEYSQQNLGDNVIFITLGTGIGGAIIINGQLYRGSKYAGAELGCIPIDVNGKEGFWEDFASTTALVEAFKLKSGIDVNGRTLIEKYIEGNEIAKFVIDENTRLLGKGIAAYINIFNPDHIIIGGGISEAPSYIDLIRTYAFQFAMEDCKEGVKISAAKLGNKAGYLGAARFAEIELLKTL